MSEKSENEKEHTVSSGLDDPPCSLPSSLLSLMAGKITNLEFEAIRVQSQYGESKWNTEEWHNKESEADADMKEIQGNGYNARKVAVIELEIPISDLRTILKENTQHREPTE